MNRGQLALLGSAHVSSLIVTPRPIRVRASVRTGATGFSRAVLTKWHDSAPKKSRAQLKFLLGGPHGEAVAISVYLDGMVIEATGASDGIETRASQAA